MLRPLRTLFRLLAIARTLARHDALDALETLKPVPGLFWLARLGARRGVPGRPGQKLARALTDLGPTFIKLGQFLSTRADLLGEQPAADLSELQDDLPPFAADAARATIEAELGRPLDRLFESFEAVPLSAASIAQVHLAVTTADGGGEDWRGREVVVKVLRPGIERAFARDLELLYSLAGLIERTRPKLRRFKPLAVVRLFEETVAIEMDLRMEAAAASELLANFAGDPAYRVPEVDWERTARRVMTQERLSGIPLDDRDALLAAGHDLTEVLTKAAAIFFNQVFRDGFFHGDQHPGNMSVDPEGNIIAVDFGIMGRLDRPTRRYLADMLLATLAGDYRRLADVHVEAGYLPPGRAPEVFAQALRSVCEPIAGRPLNEISFARLLAQLLQLTESFDMPVQPQLLLLQKNMLMAEGISRSLDPSLNIWALAEPLIAGWVRDNHGPEARLRDAAADFGRGLQSLPRLLSQVERASGQIVEGGLRLHPDTAGYLTPRRGLTAGRLALWLAGLALLTALAALIWG